MNRWTTATGTGGGGTAWGQAGPGWVGGQPAGAAVADGAAFGFAEPEPEPDAAPSDPDPDPDPDVWPPDPLAAASFLADPSEPVPALSEDAPFVPGLPSFSSRPAVELLRADDARLSLR